MHGIATMDESRLSPRGNRLQRLRQSYFDHLLLAALSVPQNGFDFRTCNDNPLKIGPSDAAGGVFRALAPGLKELFSLLFRPDFVTDKFS
jgi:hypothetical protein